MSSGLFSLFANLRIPFPKHNGGPAQMRHSSTIEKVGTRSQRALPIFSRRCSAVSGIFVRVSAASTAVTLWAWSFQISSAPVRRRFAGLCSGKTAAGVFKRATKLSRSSGIRPSSHAGPCSNGHCLDVDDHQDVAGPGLGSAKVRPEAHLSCGGFSDQQHRAVLGADASPNRPELYASEDVTDSTRHLVKTVCVR